MTVPTTMCGVWLTGHGDFSKLEFRDDIAVPQPDSTEVLIEVAAAGVNNTDINTRTTWYSKGEAEGDDASCSGSALEFPRIQGADVCGRIVAVGSDAGESRIR